MAGAWSDQPDRGARYGTARSSGYQTGRVYSGRGGRYESDWDRQPAYAEDPWDEDTYYGQGTDPGWGYPEDDGYADARRRAAARRRTRPAPRPEVETMGPAIEYPLQPIISRGGQRRQLVLVGLLGSAVALLGERVVRLFGGGGPAAAATTGAAKADTMDTGTQQAGAGTATTAPAGGQAAGTGKVVLANTTDIPVGSAKIIAAHKIVVTQPTAGTFKAYSTVCTHAGCLLDQVKGDKILCPCHPGVFNLDGTVASGPPPSALAAKKITVSGNEITL